MSVYSAVIPVPQVEVYDAATNRFVQQVDEYQFQFKLITRRQYELWAIKAADDTEFEDLVLQHTLLSHPPLFQDQPWEWDNIYAGIPVALVQEIIRLSGFGEDPSPQEVTTRIEEYIGSQQGKGDELIMTAYTCYKLDDLHDMDLEQWSTVHAFAHKRLALLGVDPDLILDPEAAKRKMQSTPGPAGVNQGGKIVYNPHA